MRTIKTIESGNRMIELLSERFGETRRVIARRESNPDGWGAFSAECFIDGRSDVYATFRTMESAVAFGRNWIESA